MAALSGAVAKRPTAINDSSVYDQFPPVWAEFLHNYTEEEQKDAQRLLGQLLKNIDFTLLNEAGK